MKKLLLIGCFFTFSFGFSQNVSLVKDVYDGINNGTSLYSSIVFNGELYFVGSDADNGYELWKTDGTSLGTTIVKNINEFNSSNPGKFAIAGGLLYFIANDGVNGTELWKTNGTEAGTLLVKNINAGGSASIDHLIALGGKLIFFANDGISGNELWESDGTEIGTKLLKDIRSGASSSKAFIIWGESSIVLNGELIFPADDGTHGVELWKTDGTTAGTVLLKDIWVGIPLNDSDPGYLTMYNGEVYFSAVNNTFGIELWKTDGTTAGTTLVKNIKSGDSDSSPSNLTVFNGELYFSAIDDSHGNELWKTDGTDAGTVLVKDIDTGGGYSNPSKFIEFNGNLFFTADNGSLGYELWKTDGTDAGTTLVKDIRNGASTSDIRYLAVYKSKLFFGANDGSGIGKELWVSDGTAVGTVLKKEIYSGFNSSSPRYFIELNEKLYFEAKNATSGIELFKLSSPNTFTAASGNWNTDANWSFGTKPVANDDVEIPAGKTVNLNTTNLEVIDLNLLGTLNINAGKSITAKGNLTADTGTLNIQSNATSSGSLIVEGTSLGNITYNRFVTGIDTAPDPDFKPWHLTTSPFIGETVEDIITNGSLADGAVAGRKGLATYDNTIIGNPWTYLTTASVGVMNSGDGYSILRSVDGNIPFKGSLKTNDLDAYAITVGDLGGGIENPWNLIGNPYPSFIAVNSDADAINNFLSANAAQMHPLFTGLYFWNPTTKQYSIINNATVGAKYIAPGQGFFVASKDGGGTITITEAMQKHQSDNLFLRTTDNRPKIVLSITNGTEIKSTEIKYIEGTSAGLDVGYDAGVFFGTTSSFNLFTRLISDSNGANLSLQCLPPQDYETMVIPVGIKANTGTEITFSINSQHLPDGILVYLENRETNTFTQLDEVNSNYSITINENMNGIGKFYLHTTSERLSLNTIDVNKIKIFKISNSILRITGLDRKKVSLQIFSVLGKELLNTTFVSKNIANISLPKVPTGVYLVQLHTENGILNKKIILK